MNFGMSNLLARRGGFTRERVSSARDELSGAIYGNGWWRLDAADVGQSPTLDREHHAGRHPRIARRTHRVGRFSPGVRCDAQIIFRRDLVLERERK
jgi:hypothetical protein